MKKQLIDSFKKYENPEGGCGDKGSLHSYLETYERLFDKTSDVKLLEIGCARGDSAMMWADYFENSEIICADINKTIIYPEDGWRFILGNATKPEFADQFQDGYFDYIIDDGSHYLKDQISSFKLLFSKLKIGGKYVIEDIQDIGSQKSAFLELNKDAKVIDLRSERPLADNVLILIEK